METPGGTHTTESGWRPPDTPPPGRWPGLRYQVEYWQPCVDIWRMRRAMEPLQCIFHNPRFIPATCYVFVACSVHVKERFQKATDIESVKTLGLNRA
ncbi:hypothetical protein CaCOL14_006089 [Colletotrichum acutatum]